MNNILTEGKNFPTFSLSSMAWFFGNDLARATCSCCSDVSPSLLTKAVIATSVGSTFRQIYLTLNDPRRRTCDAYDIADYLLVT